MLAFVSIYWINAGKSYKKGGQAGFMYIFIGDLILYV